MNNFSSFKLFYDELIYKKSSYVSYAKIDADIDTIKDVLFTIRNYSKTDIKSYMNLLKKCNKTIKDKLDNILKLNKPLMEYFFIIYKSRLDVCNDKLTDLPLIISNSFYNDYRLDDKTPLDLETNNNTVPKYSSLEKRSIREEGLKFTRFEFFVNLLKNSENVKKYNSFLEKANVILSLKPLYNETHFIYFRRIENMTEGFDKLYKKLEDKAKESDDYEDISLRMRIAYRKKFGDWDSDIREMVKEYYDYLFAKKEKDLEIKSHFNVANEFSYNSYLEMITDMKEEKDRLELMVSRGTFVPVEYYGDTYLLRFREVLINSYFDERYYYQVEKGNVKSYVEQAINLYSLARDLEDSVLDYYLYVASHSKRLLRNNDVKSALITNLYDLYSPVDCLDRYEELRKDFANRLSKESNDFKKEYNTALLNERIEYGFKGAIPNVSSINTRLNERCKIFIIENCLDNIVNFDETGLYDTRNYDLEVLCSRLNFDDILDLYNSLKSIFGNFPDSLPIPQEFIANVIYNRLNYNDNTLEERIDRLKQICISYLKEEPIFTR